MFRHIEIYFSQFQIVIVKVSWRTHDRIRIAIHYMLYAAFFCDLCDLKANLVHEKSEAGFSTLNSNEWINIEDSSQRVKFRCNIVIAAIWLYILQVYFLAMIYIVLLKC